MILPIHGIVPRPAASGFLPQTPWTKSVMKKMEPNIAKLEKPDEVRRGKGTGGKQPQIEHWSPARPLPQGKDDEECRAEGKRGQDPRASPARR